MGRARAASFSELDSGCFVCTTHKTNKDGYLRKVWVVGGERVAEMFHRFIYRAHYGEIPDGHEVDHKCGVRPCCNPNHLQVLPRSEHLDKTNRERYAKRRAQAHDYWCRNKGITGTALGDIFGVTFSTACGWIREWKKSATPG